MPTAGETNRRTFVRGLAVAGAVVGTAGCSGGDDDGGGGTSTATPTDTETTETATETVAEDESVTAAVDAVNETISSLNEGEASIASLNEGLENVDPVAPIDPVEAESADAARQAAQRLREDAERVTSDIVDRVPREINAQAGFLTLVDEESIETVQDLRDAAEDVGNEDAAAALTSAADLAEYVTAELTSAADRLESAADRSES